MYKIDYQTMVGGIQLLQPNKKKLPLYIGHILFSSMIHALLIFLKI